MLHGFEHTVLESISCIAEGPAAIAISRGGAKKTYHHRDPNEDACGFAWNDRGTPLVVADGHAGSDAAQVAVERVVLHHAERLLGAAHPDDDAWAAGALDLAADVHAEILRRTEVVAAHPSRTTLSVALALPSDDWQGWLSVGDSLCFCTEATATRVMDGPARTTYLGSPTDDRASLSDAVVAGTSTLAGASALVLATDGLSEEGIGVAVPADAVHQAVDAARAARTQDLRPHDAARGPPEMANTAHRDQRAGDNIATAVAWLGD